LTADLTKMGNENGLRPDFIFFTGDVVFGELGNEPGFSIREQFDGAAEFLDRIRGAFDFDIPRENVFIVPGNHDVNRQYVSHDQTIWLDSQTDLATVIDLIQKKPVQWKRYIER